MQNYDLGILSITMVIFKFKRSVKKLISFRNLICKKSIKFVVCLINIVHVFAHTIYTYMNPCLFFLIKFIFSASLNN